MEGHGGPPVISEEVKAKLKAAQEKAKKAQEDAIRKEYDNLGTDTVSDRIKKQFGPDATDIQKDIISGSQFGEAVLGPEGLERMGTDPAIQALQEQSGELAKGFSSRDMMARREKGLSNISAGTTARSRQLQAMLARTGVKGQAAGAQLGQIAAEGIQARGDLERDLIIADRDAKERGFATHAGLVTGTKQFDIGQAAKEKDIALQAGLGIAGLGATERGSERAAEAAKKAAKASKQKTRSKFLGIF